MFDIFKMFTTLKQRFLHPFQFVNVCMSLIMVRKTTLIFLAILIQNKRNELYDRVQSTRISVSTTFCLKQKIKIFLDQICPKRVEKSCLS